MSVARWATVDTPDGAFTVLADAESVLASGWTDDITSLVPLVHPSLRPAPDRVDGGTDGGVLDGGTDGGVLDGALTAVAAYYDGDLAAPGRVAVRQRSGGFQSRAWEVLRTVTAGEWITYTEYAARAGRPAAVRAAAAACAANAAALFVPCHRVLRSDGSLGGFRYGLAVKARLLEREGFLPAGPTLF